jgi:hypothetical protein
MAASRIHGTLEKAEAAVGSDIPRMVERHINRCVKWT